MNAIIVMMITFIVVNTVIIIIIIIIIQFVAISIIIGGRSNNFSITIFILIQYLYKANRSDRLVFLS